MPAECEINVAGRPCGLGAVRRCTNNACSIPGGAPICASHLTARGWCTECVEAEKRSVTDLLQRAALAVDQAKARIVDLAAVLGKAGVPQERYFQATKRVKKKFGGYHEVADPPRDLYGWAAGNDYWSHPPEPVADSRQGPGRRWSAPVQQYVTTSGDVVPEDPGYDMPNCMVGIGGVDRETFDDRAVKLYESIVSELEKLARAHGISVT
jgi:hypothetical protein